MKDNLTKICAEFIANRYSFFEQKIISPLVPEDVKELIEEAVKNKQIDDYELIDGKYYPKDKDIPYAKTDWGCYIV